MACIHHGNRLAPEVFRQCYLANHRMAQRLVLSATHRPVLMIGPPPCPSGGGEARGSASVNCSVYGSHRRIATCSTARGQIYLGNPRRVQAAEVGTLPSVQATSQATSQLCDRKVMGIRGSTRTNGWEPALNSPDSVKW